MLAENLTVLYEDGELLVLLKPAGVTCAAGGLLDAASCHIGGEAWLLHRLDREVSGVIVYGKTKEAAAGVSAQIAERKMEKVYLAWVTGAPPETGRLTDLLYHDKNRNKTFVVKRPRKGVREAALTYEVLRREGENSLLRIRLETGRTHQIRVQFSSRGYPLLGDPKYGGPKGEMRLFSHRITLTHPKTGETLTVTACPDWAEEVLGILR